MYGTSGLRAWYTYNVPEQMEKLENCYSMPPRTVEEKTTPGYTL
jgi:hypothetical protein